MSDKIHRRVAEVLGMSVEDEEESFELDVATGQDPTLALIPVPTEVVEVDNPELPVLRAEMTRIEHGQAQTERMIERGLVAVQNSLSELPLMPPMYKPRAMEATAELFKAVADLAKHKIEIQIKLAELKMKQAAFIRNKGNNLGSNNTFVINREDLLRSLPDPKDDDAEDDDDK